MGDPTTPPVVDPPQGDPPQPDPPVEPSGDPPDPGARTEPDWKAEARKHEGRAKKSQKEIDRLQAALKEREDEDKSEHDKAIEAAREEGRKAAQTEGEKERRHDRLEVQVTRLASKGVTVGEGDEAKTVRFADAEDALLHIERGDTDELFNDEGKVQTDALEEALRDLIARKPHLAAGEGEKRSGSADTRRGVPGKDPGSMTPAEVEREKYPANFK